MLSELLLCLTPTNAWLQADAMLRSLASQSLSRKTESSVTPRRNLHGLIYSPRGSGWTMSVLRTRKVEQL